ncbi:MAG: FeoB-associated Cys-rich membrane protein [Fervidobacterium sp.]|uniref:Uncharacterized protein n=1 Tax=Fervidobacterium gondwanense DSM 13020 TaxID=1121883 RepID=A0A1M7SWH0_FERGO|nr:FeoB-associated Cys-rich membrane protein [Fervidobacterium gondwanense]UXF00536.1 hypothetical protein IB67_02865 [Fervidobacterium riparium]SHN62724.1 hypothetical protein SAMN02745226_01317 [Fervidobacterium gondwanense DSM 13020]
MDSTFVILLVIFIIVSDAIVLFVIYRFRKKKKEQENLVEDYINGHGYRYIAREDKTFQKEFSKTFSKLNPNFRWKNLKVQHLFTYPTEEQEGKSLCFELEVTARNYYKKYFCYLLENFHSQLPECSIIPRSPFEIIFLRKNTAFDKTYKVIPKEVSERLPLDLKEQLVRYFGVSVIYANNQLLITKEYKSKEEPLQALSTCEEIFDIVKMYS